MIRSFHEKPELEVRTVKAKRVLVLLALVLSIGLVFSACSNPVGSDDDRGGSNTNNYTSPTIGTLVYVPAGSFQRDATAGNVSIISRPFKMSKHPITQSQFEAVMGTNPSSFSSGDDAPDRPVEPVSWYDAIAFANKLSVEEGLTPVYGVIEGGTPIDWDTFAYGDIPTDDNADWNAAYADWDADGYRLPTEMEWMWAAMGADQDARPGAMQDGINRTGYSKDFAGYDGSNSIDDYAWYDSNGGGITHPVGNKLPNELGLYDMSGNVWEWNWDWSWSPIPGGEQTDYRGAASSSVRLLRGGSWSVNASLCTVAYRSNGGPQIRGSSYGFRLVRP
jgi:formylglycine-generating enzyme required for sulfatase activity